MVTPNNKPDHSNHNDRRGKSVVSLRNIFWMASRNLWFKKLRTTLTMLGIIIGLGAIVFLVSLALGLHKVVNHQVIGSRSVKTVDVTSPDSAAIQLNDSNIHKIANIANVTQTGEAFILPGKIDYQNSLSDVVVYAVDNNYLTLSSLSFSAGTNSLPSKSDAIINTSMLSLIGISNSKQAIGHNISTTVEITNADGSIIKQLTLPLKIVGVANTGSGAGIYIKNTPISQAGETLYDQVKVVVNNESNINVVRQQIEGLGFTTSSPIDTLNEINTVFKFFTIIVAGFGGIGMIIAILGMFNTLTISLLERTSEVGLMISLGARKGDIQRLLIAEGLLLALVGCIIGIVLAWLLGGTVDLFLGHLAHSRGVDSTVNIFTITPLLVIATLLLAVLLGLVVAFYPAKRASSINPIDALRSE